MASFVSVQSPAVIKSVPVSKLVELIAINSDGLATPSNEPYVGFRNLLATRQLVGLVRLGSSHAMLLAARPHQLVGMVLSRQAASAAESYHAEASRSIHTQPPTRTIIQSPPQRVSPRTAARVLTPDAILRQQRKPTPPDHTTAPIPMDSTSSTPTLDVFNALMGSQAMDFENVTAQSGSYDLSDFGYPDASQDMSNSFFDMSSA